MRTPSKGLSVVCPKEKMSIERLKEVGDSQERIIEGVPV